MQAVIPNIPWADYFYFTAKVAAGYAKQLHIIA